MNKKLQLLLNAMSMIHSLRTGSRRANFLRNYFLEATSHFIQYDDIIIKSLSSLLCDKTEGKMEFPDTGCHAYRLLRIDIREVN